MGVSFRRVVGREYVYVFISIYLLEFDVEKFLSHEMNNIYRAPVMVIPSVLGRLQGDSGCIVYLFISSLI